MEDKLKPSETVQVIFISHGWDKEGTKRSQRGKRICKDRGNSGDTESDYLVLWSEEGRKGSQSKTKNPCYRFDVNRSRRQK